MNIESEIKLLKKLKECLLEVGIYEYSHLGFGTCLGAVRPTKRADSRHYLGLMEHDHDSDMCYLAEKFPIEKREELFQTCKKKGLFKWPNPNGRIQRKPSGEILWFSVKMHSARCCQWFTYPYKGYRWHSKGSKWTVNEKFDMRRYNYNHSYDAIAKGTPDKYYQSLIEIDFEGFRMNIPTMSGSLLDCWYPGWSVPRKGGASKKDVVCIIKDWEDETTWRLR